MLGVEPPLEWRAQDGGVAIDIPQAILDTPPCTHALAVAFTLAK